MDYAVIDKSTGQVIVAESEEEAHELAQVLKKYRPADSIEAHSAETMP